jgi:hypothetical protein
MKLTLASSFLLATSLAIAQASLLPNEMCTLGSEAADCTPAASPIKGPAVPILPAPMPKEVPSGKLERLSEKDSLLRKKPTNDDRTPAHRED